MIIESMTQEMIRMDIKEKATACILGGRPMKYVTDDESFPLALYIDKLDRYWWATSKWSLIRYHRCGD